MRLEIDALIGEEGQGWNQVVAELAFECSGPERFYTAMVLFDEWLAFLRTQEGCTLQSSRTCGNIISHLALLGGELVCCTDAKSLDFLRRCSDLA